MATDLERFVEADGRAELVKDVRQRIDAEGITYIYYQFPSVTGRIMGKGVPAQHWESIAEKGFQLVYGSTANLFTDRHGNYIGYGPEAAELVGIPEPETFQPLPWDPKVARVWCSCFRNREEREDPAAFLTSDCRGNLKRIQAEFEESTGLHLRAGTEPEMMWLKLNDDGTPAVDGRDQALLLPHRPVLGAPADHPQDGRVRPGDGARHDPGRPRGRARPDRAQLRLRPRGADRRQPLDVPPDLQGRSVASSAPSRASCRSRSWASRRTAATTTSRSGKATRTPSCPRRTTSRSRARSACTRSAASSSTSARSPRSPRRRSTRTAASGTRASGRRCSPTGATRTAPPRSASRRPAASSTARSTPP